VVSLKLDREVISLAIAGDLIVPARFIRSDRVVDSNEVAFSEVTDTQFALIGSGHV
jgi:hypothetical protein